jgi:FAD/FMN-containing dehydrogenase
MSNMTSIVFQPGKMSASVGAGNTNALWLYAVALKSGTPGAACIIGACPSVGVTGFALGGGQGDITPLAGLGCDQVIGAEMVLYNGSVITANKRTYGMHAWVSSGFISTPKYISHALKV